MQRAVEGFTAGSRGIPERSGAGEDCTGTLGRVETGAANSLLTAGRVYKTFEVWGSS
jgi:hypothetical protein